MAYKTSPRTGKKRTKQQQAMYRRRRIVFGIATVLVLSFIVFCLYSLTQGVVAVNREIHHADVYAISRKEVPSPTQQQKSSVPDCDASNVALSLTPATRSSRRLLGRACVPAANAPTRRTCRTWTVACIRPNCRSKDMRKPSRNRSASQWNKIYRLCYSYDFA